MSRKITVTALVALLLTLVISTGAFAQDAAPAPGQYGAGQCVNFVDADGDGVCDNAGTGARPQDGTGNSYGAGARGTVQAGNGTPGSAFVDADGDGTCDNLGQNVPARSGTGNQNGRGGRR
jgi:hypothetical protein